MSDTAEGATMTCPKCGNEMRTHERNGVTIEQRRKCHGIFLDAGEFEPPCPFCGEPLDPQGHLCPRRNGNLLN